MPRLSDQDRLFEALPPDGEFVTNKEIRNKLNLESDRYWEVRDKLHKDGKIIIGRGYGGRVARKLNAAQMSKEEKGTPEKEIEEIQEDYKVETSLYEPFAEAIRKISNDDGLNQSIVQITAWAAKKETNRAMDTTRRVPN